MLKYVKSDVDLDLNDGDATVNHNMYCTHGIFFHFSLFGRNCMIV